jgi:hypothetical protein
VSLFFFVSIVSLAALSVYLTVCSAKARFLLKAVGLSIYSDMSEHISSWKVVIFAGVTSTSPYSSTWYPPESVMMMPSNPIMECMPLFAASSPMRFKVM